MKKNELEIIEEWGKRIDKLETPRKLVELTKDQSNVLLSLLSMDDKTLKDVKEDFMKSQAMQVLCKKIDLYHTYTFDDKALIFIVTLIERFGDIALYCNLLQKWCHENQVSKITLEDLCKRLFPRGIFNKEWLEKVWDMQKVHNFDIKKEAFDSDNTLDYVLYGTSLRKVSETFDYLYAFYMLLSSKEVQNIETGNIYSLDKDKNKIDIFDSSMEYIKSFTNPKDFVDNLFSKNSQSKFCWKLV